MLGRRRKRRRGGIRKTNNLFGVCLEIEGLDAGWVEGDSIILPPFETIRVGGGKEGEGKRSARKRDRGGVEKRKKGGQGSLFGKIKIGEKELRCVSGI